MRTRYALLLVAVSLLGTLGCGGQDVREDRTIEFAPDSQTLAFQHGSEGVFIRLTDGELRKIHQPADDEPAVSVPLWSPDGRSVIFCTGRYDEVDTRDDQATDEADRRAWDANPDGRGFLPVPAEFTVWRYSLDDPKVENGEFKSHQILTSHCNHAGLIAAGLAVMWHPSGESFFFIDDRSSELADGIQGALVGPADSESIDGHILREHSLETGTNRMVFGRRAHVLIPIVSADQSQVACVAASLKTQQFSSNNGIWLRDAKSGNWSLIPNSEVMATRAGPDGVHVASRSLSHLIQNVRRNRPVWAKSGDMFFVTTAEYTREENGSIRTESTVHKLDAQTQAVAQFAAFAGGLEKLYVHPAGHRVGAMSSHTNELVLADQERGVVSLSSIHAGGFDLIPRQFAGWSDNGNQMCVVCSKHPFLVIETVGNDESEIKVQPTSLLMPRTNQRRHLVVADEDGTNARSVFSGMRIGFARWAPDKVVESAAESSDRIAFWATFTPSHQDVVSANFRVSADFTLMPCDPAVILDLATMQLDWMPVNSLEAEQVGHYYQIHGDHHEAWKWYTESDARRARELADEVDPPKSRRARMDRLVRQRDSAMFRYICRLRLGREDAAEHKAAYDRFTAELINFGRAQREAWNPTNPQQLNQTEEVTATLRELHLATAFLSVNALDEAEEYFRQQAENAKAPGDRMGARLTHLDLLLLQERRTEYARKLLIDYADQLPAPTQGETGDLIQALTTLMYSPLMNDPFVEQLGDPTIKEMATKWRQDFVGDRSSESQNELVLRMLSGPSGLRLQ